MNNKCSRRDFLKYAISGASLLALNSIPLSEKLFGQTKDVFAEINPHELYELEGSDYKKLIREGFDCCGGIKTFVKPGDYVVLKPNAAWSRKPEEAGNTHPDLVSETVKLCRDAGAKKVDIIDHTCDNSKSSFKISGIEEAVKNAGGNMVSLSEGDHFAEVTIPNGKILKKTLVAKQVLNADCFINMPIAKDHGSATLTLCMKNHMGIVKDRGYFHVNGLHECIADISSFIKPDLNIMDCTRILLDHGPKGPGRVKTLNKVIFGINQVAVDSLATTYFGLKPKDIGYIRIAETMGIGKTDVENFKITQKKI